VESNQCLEAGEGRDSTGFPIRLATDWSIIGLIEIDIQPAEA
jgi:hypothetical protein